MPTRTAAGNKAAKAGRCKRKGKPVQANRIRVLLLIIGVALLALGGIYALSPTPPQTALDLSRSKATEKGLYSVAIEPEAGTIVQGELHSWVLTLTTPQGAPVTDATITVDGGMPDHNHGLPTAPQATAHLGDGKYRIVGVKFSMSGWWELRFAISSPAGEDSVIFNLTL